MRTGFLRTAFLRTAAVALVLATGCATVRNVMVRKDYEQVDRRETLRIVVVTAPLPDGNEHVGELWSRIARKFVFDKRDFIVKGHLAANEVPADVCTSTEGVQGVLHLAPKVKRQGDGVNAELDARLFRCRDNELVWRAEAGGTWPSDIERLRQTTAYYVEALGEDVKPYVAPTFELLNATLETLPAPKIEGDDEVMEKIESEM